MNLRQALTDAFDRWYMVDRAPGVRAMMAGIEKVSGTKAAAAKAAGIGRSTWGFWDAGKRAPSGANLAKLRSTFERLVGRPRRQAAAARTRAPRGADITATVVAYPNGARYINNPDGPAKGRRTFKAGRGGYQQKGTLQLDGGPTGGAVGAWVRGDDPAPDFLKAVKDAYGEPFGFEGDNVIIKFRR